MDDYKKWYDEAMHESNTAGYSGATAAQTIAYQAASITELEAWKDAVLDALAITCTDAPIGTPPREIVHQVIDFYVTLTKDETASQLADANRAARWESDVASQAIADLEPYRKDAERMDWIIDNASSRGGGNGFTLQVFVPVDCECVRTAIDAAIQTGRI